MALQPELTNGDLGRTSPRMMLGSGNFDFGGWEEDASGASDATSKDSFDVGMGVRTSPKGVRKTRSDFINASHGREAGSLSPVASLRQCSLTDGQVPGKQRSTSPLRLRGEKAVAVSPQAGSKRRESLKSDGEQEEHEDDGFDSWRGLGDDGHKASFDGDALGDLLGNKANDAGKGDSLDGSDITALLKPSDSLEEGFQALLKKTAS
eukprot:CAMPEP_0173420766 /NCGR_PEP_ID=MMETSP1357-20121228/2113_1 /TAXON_ID=77926 /ORGANISM="Hemiselmis rufescens, Strain PCC563" /LENGTH=206 /DNA_ID=CAMNT_0014383587 /DNA_START=35 /DNA_END=652 /DNA_ORIENTATION=+